MTTVRALKYNAVSEWVRQPSRRLLLACAACLLAAVLFAAAALVRRPAPVVETVTTALDDGEPQAAPSPVVNTPQLPARDEDVERAGDKIAEATVYLSRRQKSAALRALTEARAAARRAYERHSQQRDPASHKLLAAIKELDQAELAVERGALPDAKQKLLALNRQLDQLEQ
jgi:HAMP domain-containing protein